PLHLPSFPTRRSSDLARYLRFGAPDAGRHRGLDQHLRRRHHRAPRVKTSIATQPAAEIATPLLAIAVGVGSSPRHSPVWIRRVGDRKSTRLNSSHLGI